MVESTIRTSSSDFELYRSPISFFSSRIPKKANLEPLIFPLLEQQSDRINKQEEREKSILPSPFSTRGIRHFFSSQARKVAFGRLVILELPLALSPPFFPFSS
ncbi:hypothetical protein ACQY0O_006847 [Thecaphora frezii]